MRKAIILVVVGLIISMSITGCGISQEEYDEISANLSTAMETAGTLENQLASAEGTIKSLQEQLSDNDAEIESLNEDLREVSANLSAVLETTRALESQLVSAEGNIQSLQRQLSSKNSQISSLNEDLREVQNKVQILNAIFIPAMTGELDAMSQAEAALYFLEWQGMIIAAEDPVLTERFEAFISSGADQDMLDFFIYLLESIT